MSAVVPHTFAMSRIPAMRLTGVADRGISSALRPNRNKRRFKLDFPLGDLG